MRDYGNTIDTCAVTILSSVQSTAHGDWAIIDAGYKTFGAESIIGHRDSHGFFWNGMANYGPIKNRPDLWFVCVSAEIGKIYYIDCNRKLTLGERVEIIPNNATLVISMHKKLYGVRNGRVENTITATVGTR